MLRWCRSTSCSGAKTKLLPDKEGLFSYLRQRWQALFEVGFEVLLYDLTHTYFETALTPIFRHGGFGSASVVAMPRSI